MIDIGNTIKNQRILNGWTQTQLAGKAGVGLNFIYQLEKNKPSVQLDSVLKVLKALDLSLNLVGTSQRLTTNKKTVQDPWA